MIHSAVPSKRYVVAMLVSRATLAAQYAPLWIERKPEHVSINYHQSK